MLKMGPTIEQVEWRLEQYYDRFNFLFGNMVARPF